MQQLVMNTNYQSEIKYCVRLLSVHASHRWALRCQLGTVPYTAPFFTVITVKYGVTITVVRRNLTSTVRIVTVPYCTTRQA